MRHLEMEGERENYICSSPVVRSLLVSHQVRGRRRDTRHIHIDWQPHTIVCLDDIEDALPHIRERMPDLVRLAVLRESLRTRNPELGRTRNVRICEDPRHVVVDQRRIVIMCVVARAESSISEYS